MAPPTSAVDRVYEIVRNISYKPGWTLRVRHTYGGLAIQWNWSAPDATASKSIWHTSLGTSVVSGTPRLIDPGWTETDIVKEIYNSLVECELHELNEFFRYKERIIFDPHRSVDLLLETSKRVPA